MGARRPRPIARRLLGAPARIYDLGLGWLFGQRFVRLTHVGRRSGRQYQTMLEVLAVRPDGEVVVIAGLGPSADWFRNIQAHPGVEVALARQRFRPVHRMLGEDEAVAVMADYERRNRWVAPLVRRVLTWVVGWRYDSSEAARRRLVRERPLVGLRAE